MSIMTFDLQTIFAHLAEKEKFKGHHSPEGQAIRTLSRALNGWSAGNLSAVDVLALMDQAMEDWLKARLKMSPWSARGCPELLAKAIETALITRLDAVRLQGIHNERTRHVVGGETTAGPEVDSALKFCIQLIEKYWK
jgi:hypothetical protein